MDAIALVGDKDHGINSPDAVRKAYQYYREWFEKVKRVGVEKAREMRIEPLKGKDVRWY